MITESFTVTYKFIDDTMNTDVATNAYDCKSDALAFIDCLLTDGIPSNWIGMESHIHESDPAGHLSVFDVD